MTTDKNSTPLDTFDATNDHLRWAEASCSVLACDAGFDDHHAGVASSEEHHVQEAKKQVDALLRLAQQRGAS